MWSEQLAAQEAHVKTLKFPSGTMSPTVAPGDFIVVDMMVYKAKEPRRGDVVVFENPSTSGILKVARIAGMPGEDIQMIGNVLHIDGKPVVERLLRKYEESTDLGERRFQVFEETFSGRIPHQIQKLEEENTLSGNTAIFSVPPAHYFLLGDNRDYSLDSRFASEVGMIALDDIKGHVVRARTGETERDIK